MAKEPLPPGVLPHICDTDPPPTDPRTIVVPGVGMHIATDEEMAAMTQHEEHGQVGAHGTQPPPKAEEHKPEEHKPEPAHPAPHNPRHR